MADKQMTAHFDRDGEFVILRVPITGPRASTSGKSEVMANETMKVVRGVHSLSISVSILRTKPKGDGDRDPEPLPVVGAGGAVH